MVSYLSQAWCDRHRELTTDLPECPGATARVQVVVTGGPEGEVRYHQAARNGRWVELALGDDPAAEVTLTQTYSDFMAVSRGEVDASVSFMRGRVKVVGPMGLVMGLIPLTGSEPYRSVLRRLDAETTY
ncbi:MAG: hypothetical protein EXQ71_03485 [Acidimicrobiia bacterium]|nr:hypothetical protein [Acidimicrobiia bacterium]